MFGPTGSVLGCLKIKEIRIPGLVKLGRQVEISNQELACLVIMLFSVPISLDNSHSSDDRRGSGDSLGGDNNHSSDDSRDSDDSHGSGDSHGSEGRHKNRRCCRLALAGGS